MWSKACLVAGLVAITTPAGAWDYPGHRIVGAIADLVLQQHYPKTHQRVSALLEKRTLSEVAVFPDCAKDEEEYCLRKPSQEELDYVARNKNKHAGFHYTNSPFMLRAYDANGTGATPTDVVRMIGYTIAQLRGATPADPPKSDVDLTDAEALWLLAHLVGDIHQPLHVGQAYFDKGCTTLVNPNDDKSKPAISTLGGNGLKFAPKAPAVPLVPSLHIYWDSITVVRAMQADGYLGAERAFAKMLAASPPPARDSAGDLETLAETWFAEMVLLAQAAYTRSGIAIEGHPGSQPNTCRWTVMLDESYEKWAQDVAREQLRKAGFRLAALLVAVFPN
jgi:hypothetical protein